MIMYKGYKAWHLGLNRWRIYAPDGFVFEVMEKSVTSLIDSIGRWRKLGWV